MRKNKQLLFECTVLWSGLLPNTCKYEEKTLARRSKKVYSLTLNNSLTEEEQKEKTNIRSRQLAWCFPTQSSFISIPVLFLKHPWGVG